MRTTLVCLIAALTIATAGFAQSDTGTILGVVLDPSGASVPGAKVTIENAGTTARFEVSTSTNGDFIAPILRVGEYRVTVSSQGFKTQVRERLTLRVSDRLQITFKLETGALSETITVSTPAPATELTLKLADPLTPSLSVTVTVTV